MQISMLPRRQQCERVFRIPDKVALLLNVLSSWNQLLMLLRESLSRLPRSYAWVIHSTVKHRSDQWHAVTCARPWKSKSKLHSRWVRESHLEVNRQRTKDTFTSHLLSPG